MVKKKKKKKKVARLSAIEQRNVEQDVREKIGQGYSAVEVIEQLHLQPHVLQQYINRIHDIDREQFNNLDNVKVYTDFVEKSRSLIKELNKMGKRFGFRNQFTALVASIKQKHEINKDVVKMGQQLGFIELKGNDVVVETEMTFSTMTTEEVKRQVEMEVAELNNMANQNIIEMRPELLASLGEDEKRIKKFIPSSMVIPEEQPRKQVKIKTKVKLKRRM